MPATIMGSRAFITKVAHIVGFDHRLRGEVAIADVLGEPQVNQASNCKAVVHGSFLSKTQKKGMNTRFEDESYMSVHTIFLTNNNNF